MTVKERAAPLRAASMSGQTRLLFLAVAAGWGAPYALIKVAVADIPPPTLACARVAIGALTLLPLALRSGGFDQVRERWRWLVWLGVFELSMPFVLIPAGEQHLSSALTGVLVSAAPLLVSLMTLGMPQERGGPLRLLGVGVGFVGVAVLLGFELPHGRSGVEGALMILLACAGYASSGIVLRYKFAGTRPESVMFSAMALATVILLPLAVRGAADATPDGGSLLATLALGIGPTGLAFWGFAVLNSRVGPARASIVAYVAPVFAVALGVLFLGESVGPGTFAGLVLILGGSRLATGSR